jgi:uncharacterized protein DUF4258
VSSGLKPVRWSAHALKNLADREIPREEAEKTLLGPELALPARRPRRFLMRRYFDQRLQQQMLLRALVEETPSEDVVITVYITSKIDKYMKGMAP